MRWLYWFAAGVILMAFGVLLWLNQGVARTYILSAETLGAEITFDGRNTWFLGQAIMCEPRESALRRAPEGADATTCDTRFYEEINEPSLTLEWPDGARVSLRHEEQDVLLVMGDTAGAHPAGTLVILPTDALARQGALTFAGTMRIGEVMAPGVRGHLLGGDYKVHENNRLSDWFGRRSDVVKSGELTYGDTVRIVAGAEGADAAKGFGQVILTDENRFKTVFRSAEADAAIRIDALGMREVFIRPDIIDTLLASPYLLVIGGLLGVLANFMSLTFQVLDRCRKERGANR